MNALTGKLVMSSYGLHAITAAAIGFFCIWYPGPTLLLAITAAFIGVGSVSTVKHRSISIYAAFGLLTATAFWFAITAIRLHEFIELVPIMLLVVGVSWLMVIPKLPSAIFTLVAVIFFLWGNAISFRNRFQHEHMTPEEVVRSVQVTSTFLIIGALQAIMGFGLERSQPRAKKRKPSRQSVAVPSSN